MLFVAELSPRRAGFDLGPVYVGYVADKVEMGKVFLQVLTFSFVNIISPMFHNNFHLINAVISKTNGQKLEKSRTTCAGNNIQRNMPSLIPFFFFTFRADETDIGRYLHA
jgi:hypothetical protein